MYFPLNGDFIFLADSASQLNPLNHGWDFNYFVPCFVPSLEFGCRVISLLTKSIASTLCPDGSSVFFIACCFDNIASRISLRLLPWYGRFNNKINYLPQDQLITDYPQGIKVNSIRMYLLAQHFRRHIPRRATCIQRLRGTVDPCNTKISQLQVPKFIKDQILGFDIPMENLHLMNVLNRHYNTPDQELGLLFSKPLYPANMITQVTTSQQVHN